MGKLKKGMSAMLALVLTCGVLLGVGHVSAADPEGEAVLTAPTQLEEGDIFLATVSLRGVSALKNLQLALFYDPTVIQPVTEDGAPLTYGTTTVTDGIRSAVATYDIMQEAIVEGALRRSADNPSGPFEVVEGGSNINQTRGLLQYTMYMADLFATEDVTLDGETEILQVRFQAIAPGKPKLQFAVRGVSPAFPTACNVGFQYARGGEVVPARTINPEEMTVAGEYIGVENVSVMPKNLSVERPGGKLSLDITVEPSDRTEQYLLVYAEDPSIASVDEMTHEIYPLKVGQTRIYVCSPINPDIYDYMELTVGNPASSPSNEPDVTETPGSSSPSASSEPSGSPSASASASASSRPGGSGSGSGGGSHGGSGTSSASPSASPISEQADAVVYAPVVSSPDADGVRNVTFANDDIQTANEQAQEAEKPLRLHADADVDEGGLRLQLPYAAVSGADQNGITEFVITTQAGTITADPALLMEGIARVSSTFDTFDILIQRETRDSLSAALQAAAADAPVYSVSLSPATWVPGVLTLSLAYPGAGADAVLAQADGQQWVPVLGAAFDAAESHFTFTPDSGGQFAAITATASVTFSDLTDAEWSRPYVEKLAGLGLIGGVGDGKFEPNRNITRAEFVKMLVDALGLLDESATCAFSDVAADQWHYAYIASAAEAGITTGYEDGTFGVDRSITREELAAMTARAAESVGLTIPETQPAEAFADASDIAEYAREAVSAMQAGGILNGKGDNRFAPRENATRAEAAKIICGIYELMQS